MLELIEQYDFYGRSLWPTSGDPSVARNKVQLYKNIACDFSETTPLYAQHLQTGNKKGKKYYRLSIKAELLMLEKQYSTAKKN